jgi:hypothetical protein
MSKIRTKTIQQVLGDVNINTMFEEMMGIKDADPTIILPKFVTVRNTLRSIYKVLNQFATFVPLHNDFPEMKQGLEEVKKFADSVFENTMLKHLTDETEETYNNITKETLNELYRKIKDNDYVRRLILLCSKLEKYKSNFIDPTKMRENFVNQEPGLEFRIFDFSTLDLKLLWSSSKITSNVKKYILQVLASLHKHTHNLYTTVVSPDVDVQAFTSMLLDAISQLKTQPKLHRCTRAFKRIEQSVELLREKFPEYYRQSVASGNPDNFVTGFIVDVSNQGGADMKLTREFRTIIAYMRESAEKSGKIKDPQVKKILEMTQRNFSLMEQQAKKDGYDVDSTDTGDLEVKDAVQQSKHKPTKKKVTEQKDTSENIPNKIKLPKE